MLELDRFEWVRASEAMAMLRLEGRWTEGEPGDEARLVVEGPDETTAVEPLADQDVPPGLWRAAFPLPFDQAQQSGLSYRLVDASGSVLRELSWPDSTEAPAAPKPSRREARSHKRELAAARKEATAAEQDRDKLREELGGSSPSSVRSAKPSAPEPRTSKRPGNRPSSSRPGRQTARGPSRTRPGGARKARVS